MESFAFSAEPWTSGSFILEMKPRTEYASLFVNCPRKFPTEGEEPCELVRLEEQMLELSIDQQRHLSSSSGSEEELNLLAASKSKKRMSTTFSDILLDPSTICSISWADQAQELLMCKVKAEADYISFAPKTIKRLEEELIQACHLKEYVEKIEHNKNFIVKCRQCGGQIHSHAKSEFELGILPNDEWLDLSPQFDYFCGLSGSDCCAQHLEKAMQHSHHREGILGFSSGFSPESTRHWLPSERKIVLSNSFILFHKNDALRKMINEKQAEIIPESLLLCANCNVQIGTTLKNRPEIYKLHFSVLHVHGDKPRNSSYITNRFHSTECFLAWMLLNKCEHHSSMKLLIRSLDRTPQLLIWLLEPYVLFTKGVLRESTEDEPMELAKRSSASIAHSIASNSSISFPALKILYKLFDSDTSKQDPKANGGDSSVGILEVPMGCCLQLVESLLTSSMALPPPLRALGQFYVGFIRLRDRVD